MGSKAEYEARKAERNARFEHLSDHDARELDTMALMDRLVTALENIGEGLQLWTTSAKPHKRKPRTTQSGEPSGRPLDGK